MNKQTNNIVMLHAQFTKESPAEIDSIVHDYAIFKELTEDQITKVKSALSQAMWVGVCMTL